jgi:hypothetical protein
MNGREKQAALSRMGVSISSIYFTWEGRLSVPKIVGVKTRVIKKNRERIMFLIPKKS